MDGLVECAVSIVEKREMDEVLDSTSMRAITNRKGKVDGSTEGSLISGIAWDRFRSDNNVYAIMR